jgi:hypothetical protein
MKPCCTKRNSLAFTLVEILVVVAIVMILGAMLLNLSPRSGHRRAQRVSCVNNLKITALAFRIWEDNGKFPMEISVTNGGTMEFVGSPQTFRHFQVISNELNTPKVLFCPAETERFRQQANTFGPASAGTLSGVSPIQFLSNTNLSYFVGLDVTETNDTMFLAGDYNIRAGAAVKSGLLELMTNQPVEWTHGMHERQGNVALVDGSVHEFSSARLQRALIETRAATNRLSMP